MVQFFCMCVVEIGVCRDADNVYTMDVADRRPSKSDNLCAFHVHLPRHSWLLYPASFASGEHILLPCFYLTTISLLNQKLLPTLVYTFNVQSLQLAFDFLFLLIFGGIFDQVNASKQCLTWSTLMFD